MSSTWRDFGLSYNKYLSIATNILRTAAKSEAVVAHRAKWDLRDKIKYDKFVYQADGQHFKIPYQSKPLVFDEETRA